MKIPEYYIKKNKLHFGTATEDIEKTIKEIQVDIINEIDEEIQNHFALEQYDKNIISAMLEGLIEEMDEL